MPEKRLPKAFLHLLRKEWPFLIVLFVILLVLIFPLLAILIPVLIRLLGLAKKGDRIASETFGIENRRATFRLFSFSWFRLSTIVADNSGLIYSPCG